jgi:hypothetical protein
MQQPVVEEDVHVQQQEETAEEEQYQQPMEEEEEHVHQPSRRVISHKYRGSCVAFSISKSVEPNE